MLARLSRAAFRNLPSAATATFFKSISPAAAAVILPSSSRTTLRTMSSSSKSSSAEQAFPKDKPESEWKATLTPTQYQVLRLKGTERAGTGEYNKHFETGTYLCAGCKTPLYKSNHKFDSGCGWPAFYDAIPGAIKAVPDADGYRTEIMCANCGGHMGHVFKNEGFKNPTNERHCVNSISLMFYPGDMPEP